MADKKRKTLAQSKKSKREEKRKRKGPSLPNALRKELESLNPTSTAAVSNGYDKDEEIDSDEAVNDLYEYEEEIPEEESKKNRRFDPVDNFEYEISEKELHKEFEDEDLASDDNGLDGSDERRIGDDSEDEEDDEKHLKMLQAITKLPGEAFEGKKRKNDVIISEAYPESEYNPSRDVLDGDGRITVDDLLGPLHMDPGFSKLRKTLQRKERNSMSLPAPLPKVDKDRLERQVTYDHTKKEITKWEPLVKRNREAPTIYFDEDIDLGFSTVGAIASDFKPRTAFEKKIASLVNNDEVLEAYKEDGARLLELNKISVEDMKDRQARLAKMRSLLFRHEIKAKRIKKIKSKTYHRLLKKDRQKMAVAELDPEAAKKLAVKQEFKRAEERMTLKHRNRNKWAKHILDRGLDIQDEGTRAAFAEQQQQHALLTRKMHSMKDGSSSDDSSDDDDDDDDIQSDSGEEGALKLLDGARKKTAEVLGEADEMPKSGLLSLPFMVRGLKKKEEEAEKEAELALQEYDLSSKRLEGKNEVKSSNMGSLSGRRVFGAPKDKHLPEPKKKIDRDNFYDDTDSEDDLQATENIDSGRGITDYVQKDPNIDPNILREESPIDHDSMYKSFDDIVKNPGLKTTYEVAIFASDSWQKKKNLPEDGKKMKNAKTATKEDLSQDLKPAFEDKDVDTGEGDGDSDADSEGQMVDGILSSGTAYELPSQADLIRRAFAGDDVEGDFEMDKQAILNEENPEPEKPVLLPGWGQWASVQRKRGPPSWMLKEHEDAKKKREEALKKRKDAHLAHVIISERVDKKAEKLHTKSLPYPFTSKDVFEQSIRMPIGPEFNPATAIGALNRPDVVKKSGVIIKPIKFEEVDPHGRLAGHKQGERKQKRNRNVKAKKTMITKGIKAS